MTSGADGDGERGHGVFVAGAMKRALLQRGWARVRSLGKIVKTVVLDGVWMIWFAMRHSRLLIRTLSKRCVVQVPVEGRHAILDVYPTKEDGHVLLESLGQSFGTRDEVGKMKKAVLLYVHGGAWGSGWSGSYGCVADKVADTDIANVCVLSYRLFPVGGMDEQVADVVASLKFLRSRIHRETSVILMAHSSGAQISMLALLRQAMMEQPTELLADVVMLSAAPLHLVHHFLYEARKGVAEVSPMLPASGGSVESLEQMSPTVIAERMSDRVLQCDQGRAWRHGASPHALEGDLAARNVPLPPWSSEQVDEISSSTRREIREFPQLFVMTSSQDDVVPMYSSLRFVAALRRRGVPCRLLVYDGMAHADFVTDWFQAAEKSPRDLFGLLDVDQTDVRRRRDAVRRVMGDNVMTVCAEGEMVRGGCSAYVRDVVRILNAVGPHPLRSNRHI